MLKGVAEPKSDTLQPVPDTGKTLASVLADQLRGRSGLLSLLGR